MKNWRDVVIHPEMTIQQTMGVLDRGAQQICVVTDPTGTLLGTVTDGDVRRGILRGVTFAEPVSAIMNTHPLTAAPDTPRDGLIRMMTARELRHLPLVDGASRIVGMATLGALLQPAQRKNRALLMAGGRGSRLQPLTEDTPKPLLPVGGKPLLETILESLVKQGIRQFYVSVNYRAEQVKAHFGDGGRWDAEIQYIEEDRPLGTAGPLGLLPEPPDAPMLVMNGDLLTNINIEQLLSFHADHGAEATMGVREYDVQVPFGVVTLNGGTIAAIEEKPVLRVFVNAGIYVLNGAVFEHLIPGESIDMPALFQRVIAGGMTTAAFPIHEYWMDIGRVNDLERANTEFQQVFHRPSGEAMDDK